jgi:hypothetical protein
LRQMPKPPAHPRPRRPAPTGSPFAKLPTLSIFLALACMASAATADEPSLPKEERAGASLPLVVGGLQEAIGLPFSRDLFSGPLHPGLFVGTEYVHWQGRSGRVFQVADVGYFRHAHLDRLLFVKTDIAYRHGLELGLGFEASLGLGYGHSFADRRIYSVTDGKPLGDLCRPQSTPVSAPSRSLASRTRLAADDSVHRPEVALFAQG